MKRNTTALVVLLFTSLTLVTVCLADESYNVEEIVSRANSAAYYTGDDMRAFVNMTIIDAQGRQRQRELAMLRKDVRDGGKQKFYLYFEKPADVRGMVFLVHKHVGQDDDRWLYLPGLDLVKRIAASDKRTSYVGSHFVYEDVSGRNVDEDKHELIDVTDKHFILKNTPKAPSGVEFSFYNVWVERSSFLPVKAKYYDKQGQNYRVVEALETKTIQGHPTIVKLRATDLQRGGETVSELSDISYDSGLDDSLFTERYLRRPPREVRR